MRGRKGGQTQSKICMLVYGGHGSGKSTFALGGMRLKNEDGRPFRVLYIDSENGSIDDYITDLKLDGIDVENLYIIYTTSLTDVKECIKRASQKEPFYYEDGGMVLDADGEQFIPDMIVVDGTTILHKTTIQGRREFSKKRASVRADKKEDISTLEKFVMIDGADIEIKDYNTVNFEGQSLVLDLTASGLHYVITAREKEILDKKIIKVNGVEKEISISTGKFEPEGFKQMDYNVKTCARLYRDDNDPLVKMMVSKDRTGTYDIMTPVEDPSITDFQKLIDKNKGLKNFTLKNSLHDDIKKEMARVERETLGTTIEESYNSEISAKTQSNLANTDEILSKKRDQARAIQQGLTPGQREIFKKLLTENNIPKQTSKIVTIPEIDKYIELATLANK